MFITNYACGFTSKNMQRCWAIDRDPEFELQWMNAGKCEKLKLNKRKEYSFGVIDACDWSIRCGAYKYMKYSDIEYSIELHQTNVHIYLINNLMIWVF